MSRVDIMFSRGSTSPALDGVKVVSGLEYAIFSEQCVRIEDVYYERTLELSTLPIAVCMGGTDAANKTQRVIQELAGTASPYTIWVLLGEGYAHSYQALVDTVRADTRHEVILAKTNQSMWRVMANCALAILTGGLTTLEAIYAGLPTINLFEKEEHSRMMQGLFDLGGCLNGGLFSDSSLRKMTETLESLGNDRDRLREMRKKTQGLLDKEGSKRVLRKLEVATLEKAVARSKEAGDKA
jgi:spore coat polysaccharide biosynthesis predicted glycosyltransferase SpsG